jgi:hypothetical protein
MKQHFIFLLLVGTLFSGGFAKADLVFYTDRSAWASAVNADITVENFDAVTPYFLAEGVNNAGLIDIEILNLSEINEFNSIDDGSSILNINETPFFRGGCLRADPDVVINLWLPSPGKAFGGDFISTHSSDGLILQVDGLQYSFEQLLPLDDGDGFLGFISSNAFSTVTLFDPVQDDPANSVFRLGETFGLDDVSFAVPEPATLFILGLGALLTRKRK